MKPNLICRWSLVIAALAPCSALAAGGPDEFVLTLGEQRFDPVRDGVPAVPTALAATRADGPDLRLVQFSGAIRGGTVDEIEALGLKVVQYIHPYTYIVWGDRSQLQSTTRALGDVRWTGDFLPAYRLQPRYRGLRADALRTDILLTRAADLNRVISELKAIGIKADDPAAMDGAIAVSVAEIPGSLLPTVASIPGVYSVQVQATDGGDRGEMTNQISANNVNGSNQAFPGYGTWLSSVGVNGAGVIIANVDSGLQDNHPALSSRVIPCVGGGSCGSTSTQSSHGTHTAGIMAADPNGSPLDAYGFERAMGVAPGANLVEQLYNPTYTQAGGMLKLMTESWRNNAFLSGNSWGPSGSPLGYDGNTRQVDVGTRDADPNAAGNQPLVYVLSFMNGNGGTSSQGTPDEAKNIFTVGSTKGQNSGSGSQILQIDDISSNSAHGPALDGRKIPHIVAPGCYVDSSITTSTYGLNCGTSMASPHVAGAVALFAQYYRSLPGYSVDPSPALVKAAFLAVSKSLKGSLDADGGVLGIPFDSKQGWGRMILPWVVDPNVQVRYIDNPLVFTASGQEWTQTVSAFDPAQPVRIMLAWTDAPGAGTGGSTPAWVNNLDLEVSDGTNTFKGNVFNTTTGWSQTGGVADDRNNTEGVFVGPTAPGAYTLKVKATNIAGDGIPNFGGAQDQDFALACYNCALEPGFTLGVSPSEHVACAPAARQFEIVIGSIQGYSNPVDLSVTGLPAGVSPSFSVDPVGTPGLSVLTLNIGPAAPTGTHEVTITGTSGAIVRSAVVDLTIYNGAPAAPALTAPADGATNLAARPTFDWNDGLGATSYDIQIARDPAFAIIVDSASGLASSNWQPTNGLQQNALHYWRVRASNLCGTSNWSGAYSFTTGAAGGILLVDDDDNGPNTRPQMTDALDALGATYTIWDTNNSDNEPTADQLAAYCSVIWFTGDEFGGFCGPGAAGEAALTTWLNSGGNFLITSQDYFWDRRVSGAPNAFMLNVLGVQSVTNDVDNQVTITGQNAFAGLGPYTLVYSFSNWSDAVIPNASAQIAYSGNGGTAAISRDTGVYKTLFFGVPLEMTATTADRAAILGAALNWFNPCVETVGACCFGSGACYQMRAADCAATSGAYQGDNSTCTPSPCAEPNGACCVGTSCTISTAGNCTGAYQGDGTTCDPSPCPQPTGACCNVIACTTATEFDCLAGGGEYLGDNVPCDPNPCLPPVCSGDADCDGDVDFFDIDPFVAKLGCPGSDPVGCGQGCPWQVVDMDFNGAVDFFDIDPFVARLGAQCP